MYKAITHDVQITATPTFSPDRSEPEANRFFWTYTIEIKNLGAIQVQLLNVSGASPTAMVGSKQCAVPAWSAKPPSWSQAAAFVILRAAA